MASGMLIKNFCHQLMFSIPAKEEDKLVSQPKTVFEKGILSLQN
jgi:hypothetical protein